jgi:hypothetical protein
MITALSLLPRPSSPACPRGPREAVLAVPNSFAELTLASPWRYASDAIAALSIATA